MSTASEESHLERSLADLLDKRFSCRAFRSDPVPQEVLSRLFELAQLTPSWCNTQPWQVSVADGESARRFGQSLLNHAASAEVESDLPFPERYEGEYLARRRAAGWALYDAVGVMKGDRIAAAVQALRNFELFGAPVVAIVSSPRSLGVYGAIDCGLYVQTLMLAATSMGLASIAQASLASYSGFVRNYFGVAEDRAIVCGVALGYADDDAPANSFRTSREPLGKAVTWLRNSCPPHDRR